ncbi:response regulator [Paraconexibacter sp.]|uniref:response regulator n=1 Tax=Paraconexibacter sp. TaxID=2949640 RepID=UPI003561FB48
MRVLIADDHPLILQSLKAAVDSAEDFEVIAETDSGPHVLPLVNRTRPDLVLMDVQMPGMDGLQCLDLIRERHPDTKVVLISAGGDPAQVQVALRRGAAGYLRKSIAPAEIPSALRHAVTGDAYFPIGGTESAEEHIARTAGLTTRELEILKSLAVGMSNKQISAEHFVTEQTVKFHLSNIYRKLSVSNRAEAVRFALEQGLVTRRDAGPG